MLFPHETKRAIGIELTQEKAALIALARSIAPTFHLDPVLVCAVCEQESGWNPNATRYEQGFRERYIDRMGLTEIEAIQRSTSYGLMQIMGQVAIEQGFTGDLYQLLDPEIGLAWGCRYLEKKLVHCEGNVEAALLSWNGGGNQDYPGAVMARMAGYESG